MRFEEIYDAYSQMVYNLALHYVQQTQDAEEITQDVFVRVHQSLADFRQQATLKTWIYRITINQSLDFLKAKKRKKRLFFIENLFNPSEMPRQAIEMNHPGVALEQQEATAKIFAAINQLNENQKTVIVLSKIEQKSQKEIAEIMQISEGAIESLLTRAKANLAKMLR